MSEAELIGCSPTSQNGDTLSAVPSSPYSVDLEFFSEPLDLLLHLVNRQEVSIEEVNMTQIATRYLEVVSQSSGFDLNIATEYTELLSICRIC